MVEYFELPEEAKPFMKKIGESEKELSRIFKEGNVGHKNPQKAMPNDKSLFVLRKGCNVVSMYAVYFLLIIFIFCMVSFR